MGPSKITSILKKIQAAPLKQLSQNFLTSKSALQKITRAARLKPRDNLLEVGPGLGILTEKLLQKGQKVVAIEKDPKFAAFLRQKFPRNTQSRKLILLHEDILRVNLPRIINKHFKKNSTSLPRYKIVSNIPYNISTKLVRLFLKTQPRPSTVTLLVQKEVGERICAKAPHNNPLALFAQLLSKPRLVAPISKKCFYPAPKVSSVILNFESINPGLDLEISPQKQLLKLIKVGFTSPRKTLANNLATLPGLDKRKIQKIITQIDQTPAIRAQELKLEEWKKINGLINPYF